MPTESAARAPLPIDVTREVHPDTGIVRYTGAHAGTVRFTATYLPQDDEPELIPGIIIGWVTSRVVREQQRQRHGERTLRLA